MAPEELSNRHVVLLKLLQGISGQQTKHMVVMQQQAWLYKAVSQRHEEVQHMHAPTDVGLGEALHAFTH